MTPQDVTVSLLNLKHFVKKKKPAQWFLFEGSENIYSTESTALASAASQKECLIPSPHINHDWCILVKTLVCRRELW